MASDTPSRSWTLVDLGAGAAVLLALAGVIWSPKLSNAVARATGDVQTLTVTVDVRGKQKTAEVTSLPMVDSSPRKEHHS